jgi:Replication-relaxation
MTPRLYESRLEALEAKLSERELEAVAVLSEIRFLSTRQLERWIFDGVTPLARARAARRSIAKLAELGVVRHLERRIGGVRAGSAGHINLLTALGLRLAAVHGWITPEQARRTREPGGQFVRHYLAVAEAHLRVLEAQARGDLQVLARQAEPMAWREFTGASGLQRTLKPDAFFAISSKPWSTHWFVEVDRATISGATLDRRLATYIDFWQSGQESAARGVSLKVLWLTPDVRRLDQLRQAFRRAPTTTRGLFTAAIFDDLIATLSTENGVAYGKRHPVRTPEHNPVATREAV